MAFSAYSQIVKPAEYVEPIPTDLLLKGAVYEQSNIEKGLETVDQMNTLLDAIPSLPGEDTRVKEQLINGVKQQISQMAPSDFANPNVRYQLKNYINQITKNEDILGIAERATKYNNDLKAYKELQAKGQNISPWNLASLQQAQDYIKQGKYLKDTRFTGEVQADPDLIKFKNTILDNLKDQTTEVYNPKTGRIETTTGVSPERIASALYEGIKSDGNMQNYYNSQFNYLTKDANWQDEYQKHLSEQLAKQQFILNSRTSTPQERQEAAKFIQDYPTISQNQLGVESFKKDSYDQWIKEQVANDAKAYGHLSQTQKYDDLYKYRVQKDIDLQYKEQEAINKANIAKQLGTTIKDPIVLAAAKKLVLAGGNPYNSDGTQKSLEEIIADPLYVQTPQEKEYNKIIEGVNLGNKEILAKVLPDIVGSSYGTYDTTIQPTLSGDNILFSTNRNNQQSIPLKEVLNVLKKRYSAVIDNTKKAEPFHTPFGDQYINDFTHPNKK